MVTKKERKKRIGNTPGEETSKWKYQSLFRCLQRRQAKL